MRTYYIAQGTQLNGLWCPKQEEKPNKRGYVYIYIQLIHFAIQQKLTQHCKATILQQKLKNKDKWNKQKKPPVHSLPLASTSQVNHQGVVLQKTGKSKVTLVLFPCILLNVTIQSYLGFISTCFIVNICHLQKHANLEWSIYNIFSQKGISAPRQIIFSCRENWFSYRCILELEILFTPDIQQQPHHNMGRKPECVNISSQDHGPINGDDMLVYKS